MGMTAREGTTASIYDSRRLQIKGGAELRQKARAAFGFCHPEPLSSTRETDFVRGKGLGRGSSTREADFVLGRGMKKASLGKGSLGGT